MQPRMSIIGASIRKLFSFGIGGDGDYYWDKVVLASLMNNRSDESWQVVSTALHMNEQDPYWSNVALAMHMNDDPYWSNVVLAMHMDGINGGTVFTDVKGKGISRFGNAQTVTAIKKFGTASASFDGTGDYLTTANSIDFNFSSGDFTIEAWIYPTAYRPGSWCSIIGKYVTTGWRFLLSETGLLHFNGNSAGGPVSSGIVPLNKWTHVAAVMVSGTVTIFINGKKDKSGTCTITDSASSLFIASNDGINFDFYGYMDDLRVTKGVARYISNFLPLGRGFTDGLLIEEKGKTPTIVGNPVLTTTVKKFGTSSLYFDGNGDYLTFPYSTDIDVVGGDFTFEAWIYSTSWKASGVRLFSTGGGAVGWNGSTGIHILLQFALAGEFGLQISNGSAAPSTFTSTLGSSINKWNHVTISLVHSTRMCYIGINGIVQAGTLSAGTISRPTTNPTLAIATIPGEAGSSVYAFVGYINDLRFTKGVARYTSNFIVPQTTFLDPITAPTFYDEKLNYYREFGTPTLTSINSKFGGMSASFDGVTDYLLAGPTEAFGFLTKDFTVECWVKTPSSGTILDNRNISTQLGLFGINSDKAFIWNRSAYLLGGTTLTTDTWFHLAWVRYKDIITLYVNGNVDGVAPCDGDFGTIRPCSIAADYAGANLFTGLIDDLRITKAPRYVGEFTPTNYAFLDPITRPFIVEETGKSFVANGNVVTKSPFKFSDASCYFDGTGDYLTVADHVDFDFGSGDFTIECWINPTVASVSGIISKQRGVATCGEYAFGFNTSFALSFYATTAGEQATWNLISLTSSINVLVQNTWQHVAVTRDGTKFTIFVGGLSVATGTASGAITDGTGLLSLGSYKDDGTSPYTGYIDDLRITKGVARYVGTFTPTGKQIPTYQKTYNTDPYFNKVMLGMHMDGTDTGTSFPDITGKTVSVFGNAQTKTAVKKFGTASAYFDGTGDYLSIPTSTDFDFGSGDFTVECWIYPTQLPTTDEVSGIFHKFLQSVSGWRLGFDEAGGLWFSSYNDSTVYTQTQADVLITINKWQHVAVSRVSGAYKIFVNGIANAIPVSLATIKVNANAMLIGYEQAYNYYFYGYIDDVRITKGVGRYISNFLPIPYAFPDYISPLNNSLSDLYWDQTVLAMHMDGADNGTTFTDAKGKTVTPAGNAVTKTATKKFGTASAYFDGTGDYLTVTEANEDFDFGTGDFTVEGWFYYTGSSINYPTVICSGHSTWSSGAFNLCFDTVTYPNKLVFSDFTLGTVIASEILSYNLWHHFALVRNSGVVTLYVNGVSQGSASISASRNIGGDTNTIKIGAATHSLVDAFTGYIDDLRVTKGVARYTANFQLPGAFPEVYSENNGLWSSTVLAMHMDGDDNGTIFTDQKGNSITRFNAVTKTATKKFGTASAYFDGTGDYLTVPNSANFDFGSGDFTIECWINYSQIPSIVLGILAKRSTSALYTPFNIGILSTQKVQFQVSLTGSSWITLESEVIPINTWTHVACVRRGAGLFLYINGVVISGLYALSTNALMTNTEAISIGSVSNSGEYPFNGYIDDLKIVKGTCQYFDTFLVPTRAFNNG